MLTLEIHNQALAQQIDQLMRQKFENDPEKMLQELIETYTKQQERLRYSGILKWEEDGLAYQKAIRHSDRSSDYQTPGSSR